MKLNYKRTILVGFAFFLICTFWQAYDTIIPKILTDKFGMQQSLSGIVMSIDNILALFMLPIFGTLSDKCRSKMGRRTPFILIGTIVAAAALVFLSFADNMQLSSIKDISTNDPIALEVLYDEDLTITTPDGSSCRICDEFTKDEFTSITVEDPEYTEFVIPARQAVAHIRTVSSPSALILFMALLLVILIAMSTFRSPAVALMPDVTIKPLRSKANAIINLMGAVGGMSVLILGIIFGTGKAENALMGYGGYFSVVAGIMIVCLIVFMLTVKEPQFVKEMHSDSLKYGLSENDEEKSSGSKKLSSEEKRSLFLILASVVLWYMGYNAVISKYSVYAGKVLNLDYNMTLTIASAAAIVSYIPVGMIASRVGRKKTILAGVLILGGAFLTASFMRAGSSPLLMNCLFAAAGIGWATINVNSYPMVVELSKDSDVGKYTGFYYTASMAAQTVTPILSGLLMDIKFTTLFPYASIFVLLAFVTMFFVKHGDSRPDKATSKLEAFDIDN